MTTRIVYAGPSLEWSDRSLFANVGFLPPIAEGDLFQLEDDLPDIVGIIDGYFMDRLAIFHKEIMWLMSKGVRVYGAASMGALRAAELCNAGMIGVGAIFEDYRSGVLTDDGDVAVSHAPEALGYRPLTVPLVDVLATSAALEGAEIITGSDAQKIVASARAIPFQERTWSDIGTHVSTKSGINWTDVLVRSHVHRKRLDALQMLQIVSDDEHDHEAAEVPFCFYETPGFHEALARARKKAKQYSV